MSYYQKPYELNALFNFPNQDPWCLQFLIGSEIKCPGGKVASQAWQWCFEGDGLTEVGEEILNMAVVKNFQVLHVQVHRYLGQ